MGSSNSENRPAKKPDKKRLSVRVWDVPTRIFHWALVGLVICSFITGKIGISDSGSNCIPLGVGFYRRTAVAIQRFR